MRYWKYIVCLLLFLSSLFFFFPKEEVVNNVVIGEEVKTSSKKVIGEEIGVVLIDEKPIKKEQLKEPEHKQDDPPIAKNEEQLYDPNSSVKFAAADILIFPEEKRQYVRYLSLYNIPKITRSKVGKIASFVVNSLGTRKKIFIPEFVGGSDETVIRIYINDYEWKTETWENFAKNGSGPRPQPEPYFHVLIDKDEPLIERKKVIKQVKKTKKLPTGKVNQQNQPILEDKEIIEDIEVEEDVVSLNRKKREFALAPWLDKETISSLVKETRSESPIIRADWFIVNATLPPAYYDFLKLGKNIKDFEKLIFSDEELANKAKSQSKAVAVTSIVARNNRTLTRSPAFTNGYYWTSHDSLNSIFDRKYILNLLNEKFDATEDIGSLPNRLQAYFLTDGKGNRLDFANTDIAIDNTAVDRIVRTGRSCIICHAEGIKSIEDEVRILTNDNVILKAFKEDDFYKINDLFGDNLDEQIILDQNLYRAAMGRANGLLPQENAKIYAEIYDNYAEKLLNKEIISREVAIPINELDNFIRLSDDAVILGIIKQPPRPTRRDQWEESFSRFMTVVLAAKVNAVPLQKPIGPLVPLEGKK